MSIYRLKPRFVRRLRRVEDALVARGVSADALTAAAVAVSVATGSAIAAGGLLDLPLVWLAVPPLVLVRLALNALDGSVARRSGTARPFGAALNEAGDRLSDAATIGACAAVAPPALAAGALACAFLASLAGVTALAVAGARDSGGPMGKADRGAVLACAALAAATTGGAGPFPAALWTIAAGSLATAWLRLARLRRALGAPREGAAHVR